MSLPDFTGLPIGEKNQSRVFLLEVHYDNPELIGKYCHYNNMFLQFIIVLVESSSKYNSFARSVIKTVGFLFYFQLHLEMWFADENLFNSSNTRSKNLGNCGITLWSLNHVLISHFLMSSCFIYNLEILCFWRACSKRTPQRNPSTFLHTLLIIFCYK